MSIIIKQTVIALEKNIFHELEAMGNRERLWRPPNYLLDGRPLVEPFLCKQISQKETTGYSTCFWQQWVIERKINFWISSSGLKMCKKGIENCFFFHSGF